MTVVLSIHFIVSSGSFMARHHSTFFHSGRPHDSAVAESFFAALKREAFIFCLTRRSIFQRPLRALGVVNFDVRNQAPIKASGVQSFRYNARPQPHELCQLRFHSHDLHVLYLNFVRFADFR